MTSQGSPVNLELTFTRQILEKLTGELVDRTLKIVSRVLLESGLAMEQIDEVILVGGQTRMPRLQAQAQELFGKEPHKGVNPDEVVAIGAAIQGGIMKGEVKDVLLLDVTPLTLGIETMGGVSTPLIERNTTIPTKKSEIFSTAADNQPSVDIHVFQGERKMSRDNKRIGNFNLDGIPPAPRGRPQIEVTFDLDANGILNVSAKDLGTGKEQKITITASSGLSKDEIERMRKDAEIHAAEDSKRREEVESRNQAENLCYQVEKTLSENADKIPADKKAPVETAVADLKLALNGSSIADIKAKQEALTKAMEEVTKEMYAKQPPPPPPGFGGFGGTDFGGPDAPPPPQGETSGGTGQPGDDGVIDAEYTMKDGK
jgi:molecular chaperone DnaK